MRLWSLDPSLLDRAALVAGWREGLLAQKVLRGGTRGYRQHPQLDRFRAADDPQAAIAAWLTGLFDEATRRGYRFNGTKISAPACAPGTIEVTDGQLALEWRHLEAKVVARAPEWLPRLATGPRAHPLFVVVPGGVAEWERAGS